MPYKIHHYPIKIRENHLDSYGHVNNATYIALFEEARWEFVTENGYGWDEVHKRQIGPVVLGMEVKFQEELTNREEVVIESQCIEYDRKIGKIRQVIRKQNGREACVATFVFGLFDMRARKLIPPTPEWQTAVGLI